VLDAPDAAETLATLNPAIPSPVTWPGESDKKVYNALPL
jgi:hypothetical protein